MIFPASIAKRLIVSIVAFSSVLALITTAIQLYTGYRNDLSNIDLELERIEAVHLPAVEASLWKLDRDQLQLIVSGITSVSEFAYAAVKSPELTIEAGGKAEELHEQTTYQIQYSFAGRQVRLGEFVVKTDKSKAIAKVWDQLWVTLASNGVKTFLVSFFIYWLFGKLVSKPLMQVVADIESPGASRTPSLADDGNEIDVLHYRLRNIVDKLVRTNAEREAFCYTISHDLKEPIVTVASLLDLMESDLARNDYERMNVYINHMRNACRQSSDKISGILELLRIGTRALNPISVDLDELVEDVVVVMKSRPGWQGVEVVVNGPFPPVNAPKVYLQTVMQNLLENAFKYSLATERPRVEIGTDEQQGQMVVYVRDNGRGIRSADMESIFEMFSKIEPAKNSHGIGLAIVKRICDELGWQVRVESAGPGMGSTFYLKGLW